jgi:hypothetical protein
MAVQTRYYEQRPESMTRSSVRRIFRRPLLPLMNECPIDCLLQLWPRAKHSNAGKDGKVTQTKEGQFKSGVLLWN